MKKKERTPEQKARRFKIAAGIVAFLLAFFLVSQLFSGRQKQEETVDELTTEMDRQLDSLVSSIYSDTLKVVWKGQFDPVPFDDDLIPEVIEYKQAQMKYEVLEMTSQMGGSEKLQQEFTDLRNKMGELEKKAEEAKKQYAGKILCTARGIHLEGKSGQMYAGFQTYSVNTHSSIIEGLVKIQGNN